MGGRAGKVLGPHKGRREGGEEETEEEDGMELCQGWLQGSAATLEG